MAGSGAQRASYWVVRGLRPTCDKINPKSPSPYVRDSSPLGTLYELDGYVLLLGVDHGNNTSLHLAENRANWAGKFFIPEATAMLVQGQREWVPFKMLSLETDDFNTLGDAYESNTSNE